MLGLPEKNARSFSLLSERNAMPLCSTSRITMGMMPYVMGVPGLSIGVAATSAIITAMMSSKGCSSPA